jgi:hypothetical protein
VTEYPILVERFPRGSSLDLGCCDCGHWWHERDPDRWMMKLDSGDCPRCGSFDITSRYEEADKCPGCGKLSQELDKRGPLKGACSRVCMLQAEYAEQLKAAS